MPACPHGDRFSLLGLSMRCEVCGRSAVAFADCGCPERAEGSDEPLNAAEIERLWRTVIEAAHV